MQLQVRPLGEQVRDWRSRRRLSQMDLALEAEISTHHLSFIETGRSQPSREVVLLLAKHLDVPLRERNAMLLGAGYAPVYSERPLDDPGLAPARRAIDLVLKGHEPFPALAVDRHWNMVAANGAVQPLLAGVAPHLLEGSVNVLRLSLHPEGLAPRILNLAEWRTHLLERLRRQAWLTSDAALSALLEELTSYEPADAGADSEALDGLAVPLRLDTPAGELSFLSTTTIFGTPRDITLDELAIEAFFPANDETLARLSGS